MELFPWPRFRPKSIIHTVPCREECACKTEVTCRVHGCMLGQLVWINWYPLRFIRFWWHKATLGHKGTDAEGRLWPRY